jgi:hypothetical protein
MSPDSPTVSVIMAAYNGAAFIRDTIDSVLAQTMRDFEIVVVDDLSKDDTLAVLATIDDPRVRVIRAERNGGPAVARTIAMAHARGRFIAGLDQDDICRPDRFARQLDYLDAHPRVVLVGSMIETFCGPTVCAGPFPTLLEPDQIEWAMLMLNPISWSSVMMRGEAARALVPFERDEYRFAEDFDLYQRIRAHGQLARIDEPLLRYRLHAGGASQAFEEGMIASAARVLAYRWGTLFGDRTLEATTLMSRHASARHAPPDAATLVRCGEVMERLLAVYGDLAPGFAAADASRVWWRIAHSGLRAGHYGLAGLLRARPSFSRLRDAKRRAVGDAAVGVARRIGLRA